MKNLIRIFLIVVIVGAGISIGSSCSDENDCSLAGRPMMYCTLYTIDEITDLRVNDTLDSLTITALRTDSIILNNQKKVHTLMLPLRIPAILLYLYSGTIRIVLLTKKMLIHYILYKKTHRIFNQWNADI